VISLNIIIKALILVEINKEFNVKRRRIVNRIYGRRATINNKDTLSRIPIIFTNDLFANQTLIHSISDVINLKKVSHENILRRVFLSYLFNPLIKKLFYLIFFIYLYYLLHLLVNLSFSFRTNVYTT
jgi:hypothetical protein